MSILFSFRALNGWDENHVARELEITLDEYKNIEAGVAQVDDEIANRLSKLYLAPTEVFYPSATRQRSIVFSHCNIHGASGYINQLYQNDDRDKDDTIAHLKMEINFLREQNEKLLMLLMLK